MESWIDGVVEWWGPEVPITPSLHHSTTPCVVLAAGHLLGLVDLEDVAFLDVVEVLDQDAALVAGGHLADLLAVVAEAVDAAIVDDLPRAHHPHVRAAQDATFRDVAASDHVVVRKLEGLAHLRL